MIVTLTEKKWAVLHLRLAQEYHDEPSVLLIRGKMRDVLGFTTRRHTLCVTIENPTSDRHKNYPRELICLDFYDDVKETFFRLKYAEYL